jgi:hypothetical protein
LERWVVDKIAQYLRATKVTILKRKRKYIWGFMTFLERRERVT